MPSSVRGIAALSTQEQCAVERFVGALRDRYAPELVEVRLFGPRLLGDEDGVLACLVVMPVKTLDRFLVLTELAFAINLDLDTGLMPLFYGAQEYAAARLAGDGLLALIEATGIPL